VKALVGCRDSAAPLWGVVPRRLTPGLIGLCAVAMLVLPASARGQTSIEVSPLRVELQAQPGGSHTQAVTVSNPGEQAVKVRATLSDWHLSRDGAPQFEDPAPERPFAASDWVRFAPPEFTLEPGKQGIVRFTVSVPPDAQPAGYRTGILFEFVPDAPQPAAGGRQVVLKSRIATLVYVHVGQPPPAVELTNLQVREAGEQTQVVAGLRNRSRRSVRTKGNLLVYDGTGTAIAQIPLPDVPVLPESERDLAITASDATRPLPSGQYRVELKLDVGMPALLVGETTLKVAR
jgi:P pilus assembly chaperone PapD